MKEKKSLVYIILLSMFLLLASNFFLHVGIETNSIKTQANLMINKIEEVLRENEKDLIELTESVKEEYIIRAKAVSYILEHDLCDAYDIDELKKIAVLMDVDEIHLFDTNGTIYAGTNPEYYGLNMDDGEQVGFFKPMLTDRTLSLCQDVTPNTAVSKPMMYALVWREDGTGMIQIGLEPKRVLEKQEKNAMPYLFSNMPSQENSIMCVAERTSQTILGATEKSFTGMTLSELGIDFTKDGSSQTGFFSKINGESYYCIFRGYSQHYIAVMYKTTSVFANLPANMLIFFIFLTIVSVVMMAAISYYMKKEEDQQKALQLALQQAESASKAKTNFLFNMSHDIHTPMNAIFGLAKIAEDNINNKEKVLDALKNLNNASKHLERLINSVLDMARIESGNIELNLQPYHLPTTMKTVEPLFTLETQKKNIDFSVTWDIKDEIVFYDKLRMEQIELNLIGNAIKYTPEGGTITYTLTQVDTTEDGYAVYEGVIKDTGIGMSEEFCKHLFEMFTREKNSTSTGIQGTGLGLSITKNMLEKMGGTISCESKQGVGTTFTFRVPLKIGTLADLPEEEVSETHHDLSGKRLLLAEDIEINREIVIELLSEYGILIEVAEDGLIAVDKVSRATPGYYGLILMDIQMPNMDGYTATKNIRHLSDPGKANIPIIALTANTLEEDKKNAFAAGMNDHIAKPIDLQVLVAALEKYFSTENK